MKKSIIFCLAFILVVSAEAQKGKGAFKEKIESYRIAFITERLDLTPEESQKFWPVYNQYHDQLDKIRDEKQKKKSLDLMADAEVEQYITARLDVEQKELNLKKEYVQKFRQVLSARKVALLQDSEKEFRQEILKRAKARKKMEE
jgi:Spy/CpxP family protein refolding chaperone